MKIMHVSDLHIGCRMYGIEQRECDFYNALNEIKKIAIGQKVDVVLIAGDLFDSSKPSARAVYEVSKFVRDLTEHKIKTIGIEGNHDLTKDSYWLRTCGIEPIGLTPYLLDSTSSIEGFNYCDSDTLITKLEDLVSDYEEKGICAPVVTLHCGFQEMGAGFNPDLSVQQVVGLLKRIGCKYVAIGHIHIPIEQQHDGIWFVQPGSLEMKSIDEPHDKLVEIVELDQNKGYEVVSLEQIHYKTRTIVFFNIEKEEDINEDLHSKVKSNLDSLCVFYIQNAIKDGVSRVTNIAKDYHVMFRVIPVGGDVQETSAYDRKNSMNLLKDAVETFFDEESDQFKLVMEILTTGNPRIVIENYLNENN